MAHMGRVRTSLGLIGHLFGVCRVRGLGMIMGHKDHRAGRGQNNQVALL